MTFAMLRLSLTAAALLGSAGVAWAEPFTWNPQAVNLNGSAVTADTLILGDYAQITFGDGGTTFTDRGFLPVVGFSLNGQAVPAGSFGAPGGWGAFVRYVGTGTQTYTPLGVPNTATFDSLSYEVVGYNGVATFGFAADGSAITGGPISDPKTLERGSLISGSLGFQPGPAGLTIKGTASATFDGVEPGFMNGTAGRFDITFMHPPGEYAFTSSTTLQVAGATSSSAIFVSADPVAVPEPASLALLGLGLLGIGWFRGVSSAGTQRR